MSEKATWGKMTYGSENSNNTTIYKIFASEAYNTPTYSL